ncbi:flavin reductase family protein [Bacillus thermotolerans]|nr:flavin reductase family protein [Bacillus thermotolerans]
MEDYQFRQAMGKFATGVTVITTEVEEEVYGMTANAFMSVSLDPKLVVISIGEKAQMLERIKKSQKFAVNILAADQKELSMIFAGQIEEGKEVPFSRLGDYPVIEGAAAQITCEVSSEHVEGDHTLFIGRVTNIHLTEANPLIFYSGRYRSLEEEEVSAI